MRSFSKVKIGRPSAVCALGLIALGAALLVGCLGSTNGDTTNDKSAVMVFAAASTTDVISELADRYEARTGTPVTRNFASSSTLARQIQAGAAAEVYISADDVWMDIIERDGLIDSSSRIDLLGNRLVLIAPKDEPFTIDLDRTQPLAVVSDGRIAIGDPEHVPAGRYARQALRSLGWWDELSDRVVAAADVRSVLAFVERGEARAGIVYATDVRVSDGVMVVAELPTEHHDPVHYPAALTTSANGTAADFLEYLTSDEAAAVFRAAGFEVLP